MSQPALQPIAAAPRLPLNDARHLAAGPATPADQRYRPESDGLAEPALMNDALLLAQAAGLPNSPTSGAGSAPVADSCPVSEPVVGDACGFAGAADAHPAAGGAMWLAGLLAMSGCSGGGGAPSPGPTTLCPAPPATPPGTVPGPTHINAPLNVLHPIDRAGNNGQKLANFDSNQPSAVFRVVQVSVAGTGAMLAGRAAEGAGPYNATSYPGTNPATDVLFYLNKNTGEVFLTEAGAIAQCIGHGYTITVEALANGNVSAQGVMTFTLAAPASGQVYNLIGSDTRGLQVTTATSPYDVRQVRPGAMSARALGTQHYPFRKAWMPQVTSWGLSGFLALTALGALTGGGAVWWWTNKPEVPAKAIIAIAPAPVVNTSGPLITAAAPEQSAIAPIPPAPEPALAPEPEPEQAKPQAQPVAAVSAPKPNARKNRESRESSAQIKPASPAMQATVTSGVKNLSGGQPGSAAATVTARAEQLYQQALSESKQSQPELALKSLREALDIQPSHVQARLVMARLFIERKQTDAAADLLADGLMLLPQQSSFTLALAPLWFASNRQDEAMSLLAQSAKSADASPEYHVYYASQLLRLKRFADAGKHYNIALRSNPAMVDWLIGLGLSLQGTSNDKEAMDAFKRAIDTGTVTGQKRELVEQMITGLKARVGS